MKSFLCQLNVGIQMLGKVIFRKALGLLSSKRSKPGPQPETASYTNNNSNLKTNANVYEYEYQYWWNNFKIYLIFVIQIHFPPKEH